MKKMLFYTAFLALVIFSTTSCSRCYDCSHVVYIEVNGVQDSTVATDEFCTADNGEVEEKENQGYTCVSQ